MSRKKHNTTQIIDKLRLVERMVAEGNTVEEAVAKISVSVQTYYRWKRKFDKMGKTEAKRLKNLETENARLKKLVAELSLQNDILKEVNEGNF